jgi:hypothetical protein
VKINFGPLTRLAEPAKSVGKEFASLRTRIADPRRDLEHARNDYLPPGDIEARARKAVEEAAAFWLQDRASSVLIRLASPRERPSVPWHPNEALPFGAMCVAEPDRAVALLMAIMRRIPYDAGAPAS